MDIAKALSGGDKRSIGRSNDVATYVLAHGAAVPGLVALLRHPDAVVRMRAADALEKLSARKAEWLTPFADDILAAAEPEEQEICWHAAQILPRLDLDAAQLKATVALMRGLLGHESRIVRVFALTGLVDLSRRDHSLRPMAGTAVQTATMSGIPSLAARARKLQRQLGKDG
ncbi:MAG: hypothetical protein JNK34_01920 [Tabrizicola sp.]|nr:hypothetical protein [Tabrizicola sp.]